MLFLFLLGFNRTQINQIDQFQTDFNQFQASFRGTSFLLIFGCKDIVFVKKNEGIVLVRYMLNNLVHYYPPPPPIEIDMHVS